MGPTGMDGEGLMIGELTEDEWNALPHSRGHRSSAARTQVRAVSARPVYIYGVAPARTLATAAVHAESSDLASMCSAK